MTGKSLYSVRPLTYCDINKIDLTDLKQTLNTYPEFAQEFMNTIQVTFNLKRVSQCVNTPNAIYLWHASVLK